MCELIAAPCAGAHLRGPITFPQFNRMRPSAVGTAVALLTLAATGFVSARAVGPLPALGPLLDPVHGIWSAANAELPMDASATIPGLSGDTRVVYDDRAVPHIFAPNSRDAYRALGYVVARDRLFQLELQGRAGAGTLTALVGAKALPVDRATRASGMPRSAEVRLAKLDTNSPGAQLMRAYVDGVNAYVDGLSEADFPIEYKLIGQRPSRMHMIDILHLLNRMGSTLATTNDELTHLAAAARVGRDAANALFPVHAPIVEPIQPNGSTAARFDSVTIPPPGAPDAKAVSMLHALGNDATAKLLAFAPVRSDDAIGSNNWAVGPSRSRSGSAILAGDPHLELTLPSIWYEVHLVVKDSLDVYGVTIPGAPGVVIGFTKAVAWTFTNTGGDVMDFYTETVDNESTPTKYKLDNAWKPLEIRAEQYRSADGNIIGVDTLRFTHRGPMRRVGTQWVSIRWTVLESMRVLEGFEAAARATTSDALLASMGDLYESPAQNMLTADTTGTIAIRSTGRFPIRPGDERGDWLRDGSVSSNDWIGRWPVSDYPQAFRPAQGYLASANQEPFDPKVQPKYYGANWERPWRAMRINTLLRADSAVTPDAMRRYQSDPGSARADLFVPALLKAANSRPTNEKAARAAALLAEWDRRYTPDNRRAVLFEEMMRQMSSRLWDEFQTDSASNPIPNDMMTAVLLRDSNSVWWDDHRTGATERRDDLLVEVIASALDTVTAKYGAPNLDGWRWDKIRHANIMHLTQLPAFSRLEIPVQGGNATLWPSTGNGHHGPSWRMVVEMTSPRRAWAIYPGGQSGNPMSARYDDRIAKWSHGELDSLRLPSSASDLPTTLQRARLTLTPGGGVK